MKKSIAIIFTLAMLFVFTSCFKTEEAIWEDSPSDRTNKALAEYRQYLCGAENGWILDYFANPFEQGYPLMFKFDEHSGVVIGAKNSVSSGNAYKEEGPTSYDLIADNGPVLTFNTHNSLLHCFSDPQSDGLGHEGDYEFMIISANENEFILKGKKRGYMMRMYKAPVEKTWENIYTELETIKGQIFNPSVKSLVLAVGEERYRASNPAQGLLELYPLGDASALADYYSYNVELDGTIRLIEPFRGANGDLSVSGFYKNDEGLLVSMEGDTPATLSAGALNEFVQMPDMSWRWNKNTLSGPIADQYNTFVNDIRKSAYGLLQYIDFKQNSTENSFSIVFKTQKVTAYLLMTAKAEGEDKLTLSLNLDATKASTSFEAQNGVVFYDEFESLRTLLTTVATSYTLSTASPTAPLEIVFKDAAGNEIPCDMK